tara:strand:- start:1457 stop:2230 length:774 start_codon:yes stop_codon:yes gene_type:complete
MLGSFVGDFVGSAYEHADVKGFNLPLVTSISNFTDDSVMAAATLYSLKYKSDFSETLKDWCNKRRDAGFSETLKSFMDGEDITYFESNGNGAAIRVSPIAYFANDVPELFEMVESNAMVTHTGSDAVDGAKAIALAIFLKLQKVSNDDVFRIIKKHFYYSFDIDIDELHKSHQFTTEAAITVPIAIYIALTSRSVENCLRKGLHIGGDVDSILSMALPILMAGGELKCPNEVLEKMKNKARINDPELLSMIEASESL